MSPGARAARAVWLAYLGAMRRYHRYEVRGIERLSAPGPALLAGYHGRLFALDLCMLQATLIERTGSAPRAIVNRRAGSMPLHDWLSEGMGHLSGLGPELEGAIHRGDKLIVTPGGTREGCRRFDVRYRVDWGSRMGYLRLALRYRLPVIPVAASGIDATFIGLYDGYAWAKRLGLDSSAPPWLALGPLGPAPLSPPFPVKIVQHVGEPIDVCAGGAGADDRDAMMALHVRVTSAVQALLDEAGRRR